MAALAHLCLSASLAVTGGDPIEHERVRHDRIGSALFITGVIINGGTTSSLAGVLAVGTQRSASYSRGTRDPSNDRHGPFGLGVYMSAMTLPFFWALGTGLSAGGGYHLGYADGVKRPHVTFERRRRGTIAGVFWWPRARSSRRRALLRS